MSSQISFFDKNGEHQKDLGLLESSDKTINEKTIQEIIFNKPELLVAPEIDTDYQKLISLSKEFPLKSNSIDVLLVSPEGNLCIVETKLWRNSQAQREVVAQVLDYAKDLTTLSSIDIFEKVTKKKGDQARKEFFELIKQSEDVNEIEFEDNLLQSLEDGRFLLLIVGDQIRPNLVFLSKTIQSAPHLQFRLELLELRLYEADSNTVIVVPTLVGKTVEETRAVVKIQYEENRPYVEVTSIEPSEPGTSPSTKTTYKEFISSMPDGFSDLFIPAYEEWTQEGYTIEPGTVGMTVRFIVNGKMKTIFEIYPHVITIYSKALETKRDLPHEICERYRENIKDSKTLSELISKNRQSIQNKDITIEDFAIHMNAANGLIHECAKFYNFSKN